MGDKSKIDQVLEKVDGLKDDIIILRAEVGTVKTDVGDVKTDVGVSSERLSNLKELVEKQNGRLGSAESSLIGLSMEHANRAGTCVGLGKIKEQVKTHEKAFNKLEGIQWFVVKVVMLTAAIVGAVVAVVTIFI